MAAERDRARELDDDARQADDARGWGATVTLDPEGQGSQATTSVADAPGTGGSRLWALVNWLRGRVDTSLGRLVLVWFRRYFEASRNSGAAAAGYITLSVLPTALVVIAIFDDTKGDESAFADRLITHMNLDGSTATLVRDLFGTTSNNLLAASLTIVIGFLIWGLSIGQLYQDVYARAWRTHVGTAADQLRFTIWFFAFSGLIALMTVSASELRANGLLALLPAWIAGSMIFWLWTPRFLLHRKISFRSLLPGALLATFVVGGTIATSPLWIGPTLNQNGKAFGSFGVVIGLFAYVLIIVTISMVCAVFAPVWAEWRQGEKDRKTQGVEPTDVSSMPSTPSGVDPAASTSSSGRALRRSRRQALVRATTAVRSTEPASVESALKDLGGRRRWLAPLVYAAGTVAVVFDGVLLLLRSWRLTLLQLFPAVWIWVMTWNMKHHFLSKPTFSTSVVIAVAVGVVLAAQIAYWCNGTFAYTMAQGATGDIRAAFGEARPHWRLIGGLALLTGGVQAGIWLLMPRLRADWLWVALLVMFVVQVYLFIAIPCWLLGVRKTDSRRERTTQSVTTGVLSGVAAMPGFLLNRIGWLLLGGGLWIVGAVLLAIGAVLHVTASSSVRVVKLSLRLRPDDRAAVSGRIDDAGSAVR